MIDFLLATNNPVAVANFLVARGLGKIENGTLVGTKPGMEYTANRVPNPVNDMPLYLFRFSNQMEADDKDTDLESKLVKWVLANGTRVDVTHPVDGATVSTWRVVVNGVNVFLLRAGSHPGLPCWQ